MESPSPFLTLGGTETYLLFEQKFPLREFAAFELVADEAAFKTCEERFLKPTADAAAHHGLGLLVDSLIWRASPDFIQKLGYPPEDLARLNQDAVARMDRFVKEGGWSNTILIKGEIGPRGDGYQSGSITAEMARAYHGQQIVTLVDSAVDVIFAMTMTGIPETIGVVEAARAHGFPVVVSATVETNGTLPDGSDLGSFIQTIDDATDGYPTFFIVNCAHPTHLEPTLQTALKKQESWLGRFRGIRANASTLSHAELDKSTSLDGGDPADLAERVARLHRTFNLRIVGGCCGTNADHLRAIAAATPRTDGDTGSTSSR